MKLSTKDSIAEAVKNPNVSLPNSLYATKVFEKISEPDSSYYLDGSGNALIKLLQNQHPLINTWMLLSSFSICLLFAVFFVIK